MDNNFYIVDERTDFTQYNQTFNTILITNSIGNVNPLYFDGLKGNKVNLVDRIGCDIVFQSCDIKQLSLSNFQGKLFFINCNIDSLINFDKGGLNDIKMINTKIYLYATVNEITDKDSIMANKIYDQRDNLLYENKLVIVKEKRGFTWYSNETVDINPIIEGILKQGT